MPPLSRTIHTTLVKRAISSFAPPIYAAPSTLAQQT
jgi:hypothetical protein